MSFLTGLEIQADKRQSRRAIHIHVVGVPQSCASHIWDALARISSHRMIDRSFVPCFSSNHFQTLKQIYVCCAVAAWDGNFAVTTIRHFDVMVFKTIAKSGVMASPTQDLIDDIPGLIGVLASPTGALVPTQYQIVHRQT